MPFDNPVEVPVEITPLSIVDDMLQRLATPDRWCQKKYFDQNRMCLMGALYTADHGAYDRHADTIGAWKTCQTKAGKLVWHHLKKNSCNSAVTQFNDNPRTTHADIIRLLIRTRHDLEPAAPVTLSDRLKRFLWY